MERRRPYEHKSEKPPNERIDVPEFFRKVLYGKSFAEELAAEAQTTDLSPKRIVEHILKAREKTIMRRKWTGRGLIVVGATVLMGSCPLYAFSLIGPHTIMAAFALIAAGSGFIAWRPRLRDTNEALVIAVKHDNYLTVPRLALEMDITFEKADKIIQELIKSGIAEVDLDHKDSDHAIWYRIKGL
jgi:hypothetical protein